MNKKIKSIIKLMVVVAVLTIILQRLLPTMTSDEFRDFVSKIGIFGPMIVVSYTVVSHIVAPLAGSPGVILGWAVYGVVWGSIFLYIASMISAVTNFWIARRYGRNWVTKLVGKSQMKQTDEFVEASGIRLLAVSRLFGWPLFELISYAAGLTNISFRKYYLVTILFSIPSNILFIYFFKDVDFTNPKSFILWLVSLIAIGAIFTLLIKKYIKSSNIKK